MAMTRKNFDELADVLRMSNASETTVRLMADFCATQNPNFNRLKFYHACNAFGAGDNTGQQPKSK